MSRRFALAWVLVAVAALPSRAQRPHPQDLVPTRSALARVGLERHWLATVPVLADERVLVLSMADGMMFAHTSKAHFHAFNAETGQHLWTAKLGDQTGQARPVSVNSFAVFVTNLNRLFALDRRTGRPFWSRELAGTLPSSATACDEDRVMVGLANGKLYGFALKVKEAGTGAVRLSDKAIDLWNWQTGDKVETRPLPAGKLVAFGSDDGKVYVAFADERTMLYRVATGGHVGAGLGALGTRLLLVPSADHNLYGVDLLTAQVLWSYPSGAPIAQEPLVAGEEVYVVNQAGSLSSIDPANGSARWTVTTPRGRLVAIGSKRVYLESSHGDLLVVDRATGQTVADPRATYLRAGLNLRGFDLGPTNRETDRLYFATASGMILCLREVGQTSPHLLRDPKALPFGYIPKEGVALTPPVPQPTEPGAEPPAAEDKPAEDKPAEDNDKSK